SRNPKTVVRLARDHIAAAAHVAGHMDVIVDEAEDPAVADHGAATMRRRVDLGLGKWLASRRRGESERRGPRPRARRGERGTLDRKSPVARRRSTREHRRPGAQRRLRCELAPGAGDQRPDDRATAADAQESGLSVIEDVRAEPGGLEEE